MSRRVSTRTAGTRTSPDQKKENSRGNQFGQLEKFNIESSLVHLGGRIFAESGSGAGVATVCFSFKGGCAGHCQCIDVCLSSQQEVKKKEDGKIAKKHQYEIKVIQSSLLVQTRCGGSSALCWWV